MVINAKWQDRSVTELVNSHNTNEPGCPTTQEIVNIVVGMAYQYPQHYFNLKEEDASEFVLFLYPELDGIIGRFNPEKGTFEQYFYSVIRIKVRIFHAEREKDRNIRRLLETTQFPDLYNGFVIEEKPHFADNNEVKSLRYVFANSKPSRRRFFVLFFSLCPYLSANDIEKLCVTFSFDFKQTISLVEILRKECLDDLKQLENLRMKRTIHYSKYLMFNDKKHLSVRDRKNEEIKAFQKRASYKALGSILGLSVGTIGNYLYYSRNLLAWVKNLYGEISPLEIGITPDLFVRVQSKADQIENCSLKLFNPVKEFDIKKN